MPALALAWKLNQRLVTLHQDTQGAQIGVLRRSQSYSFKPWLGFIAPVRAKQIGTPVRLQVHRVGLLEPTGTFWVDLAPHQHIQGCLVEQGVYAVAGEWVRVI